MTEPVTIPQLGVGMTDALLVTWLKQPGDAVERDEPVVEIETDKTTIELVSPASGRLGRHLFGEGDRVPCLTAITEIVGDQEAVAEPDTPTPQPAAAEVAANPATAAGRRPSPRARRIARESGSKGAGGRTQIAASLRAAWQSIPHFSVTREVSADLLFDALARARQRRESITATDLLLASFAAALAKIEPAQSTDLGLAVATEGGVTIPVITGVGGRSLDAIADQREAAVARARERKLSEDDLTVTPRSTLSNLGAHGVDSFTGVIPLNQPTLLTVGRAVARPVIADDGAVRAARIMSLTLNVDHTKLDGVDAAAILVAVAEEIEGGSTQWV